MSKKLVIFEGNYDHWDSDIDPTTPQEMQDYLENQNAMMVSLCARLWQPDTDYKVNDVVFSPSIEGGKTAKCVYAGTSGSSEPGWGSTVKIQDGTCQWIICELYSLRVGKGLRSENNELRTDFNIEEYAKTVEVNKKLDDQVGNIVFSVGKNNKLHISLKEEQL